MSKLLIPALSKWKAYSTQSLVRPMLEYMHAQCIVRLTYNVLKLYKEERLDLLWAVMVSTRVLQVCWMNLTGSLFKPEETTDDNSCVVLYMYRTTYLQHILTQTTSFVVTPSSLPSLQPGLIATNSHSFPRPSVCGTLYHHQWSEQKL